jgi:MFS family permease
MPASSARLSLLFSCLGHAYMHLFTAFYFVIVLALEVDWRLPYHELIKLWTLGALLVGLGALPAGWLGDRWSATGMMVVYFLGLGLAGIVCGLLDTPTALLVGLAAIGLFASIYHPVGIAWLVRNAERRGKALGINGIFGSVGVALAGLTAGALIDAFGWRAAFIVPGVVSLATGLGLLVCLRLGLVVEGAARPTGEGAGSRGDWSSSRPRRPCPRSSTCACATSPARAPSASAPSSPGSTCWAGLCRSWAATWPTATRSGRSTSRPSCSRCRCWPGWQPSAACR